MSYAVPGTSRTCAEDRTAANSCKSNRHRVIMLGASKVGKTALVQQFLFDHFVADYKPTVDEMHRVDFEADDVLLTLDLLDSAGDDQFPVMRELSIKTAEAFVIVFSLTDARSFREAFRLRDLVVTLKENSTPPIVVVGNKSDLTSERQVCHATAETTVNLDWGHVYLESSAKLGTNIVLIFTELFKQAQIEFKLSKALERRRRSLPCYFRSTASVVRRPFKRHSCTIS